MKYYLQGIVNLFVFAIGYGITIPYLVSAPSDIAVLLGAILGLLVFPAFFYYYNQKLIKQLMEKLNDI